MTVRDNRRWDDGRIGDLLSILIVNSTLVFEPVRTRECLTTLRNPSGISSIGDDFYWILRLVYNPSLCRVISVKSMRSVKMKVRVQRGQQPAVEDLVLEMTMTALLPVT